MSGPVSSPSSQRTQSIAVFDETSVTDCDPEVIVREVESALRSYLQDTLSDSRDGLKFSVEIQIFDQCSVLVTDEGSGDGGFVDVNNVVLAVINRERPGIVMNPA